jgi:hypothetical protein
VSQKKKTGGMMGRSFFLCIAGGRRCCLLFPEEDTRRGVALRVFPIGETNQATFRSFIAFSKETLIAWAVWGN